VVVECAGCAGACREGLEMLRLGGLLWLSGEFSDMGEIFEQSSSDCAPRMFDTRRGRARAGGVRTEHRQMARYMRQYPLGKFVTPAFGLRDVEAAMKKSMAADSMRLDDPWS